MRGLGESPCTLQRRVLWNITKSRSQFQKVSSTLIFKEYTWIPWLSKRSYYPRARRLPLEINAKPIFCAPAATRTKKAPFTLRTIVFSLLIHANIVRGKIRKPVTATYARTMGTRVWQCAHMDASVQWIRVGSPADLPFMMPPRVRFPP